MNTSVNVHQSKKLILKKEEVEHITKKKKINSFSKSGAYIPLSGDYSGFYAYVIILKKGVNK